MEIQFFSRLTLKWNLHHEDRTTNQTPDDSCRNHAVCRLWWRWRQHHNISPPPEPELVVLAGNINGAVITDANGQEFAITAKGRKLYEVDKRRELANTSVSDDNRKFFVNGVEEGIIVLAQQPVAGVGAMAEASEGDGVAVFGREDSGIVTRLDIETGTDANSEVTAVRIQRRL